MCEQCVAKTETFLDPIPNWWLVRATDDGHVMKKGEWGLVQCNDPDFVWTVTPKVDPLSGLSEEEINELSNDDPAWKDFEDWSEKSRIFLSELQQNFVHDVSVYWNLIEAAREKGYDPDKDVFAFWFFNYLGYYLEGKKPFPPGLQDEPDYIENNLEAFGYKK
jgi:hypothetical protein